MRIELWLGRLAVFGGELGSQAMGNSSGIADEPSGMWTVPSEAAAPAINQALSEAGAFPALTGMWATMVFPGAAAYTLTDRLHLPAGVDVTAGTALRPGAPPWSGGAARTPGRRVAHRRISAPGAAR